MMELVMVLLILGLITAMAMPSFINFYRESKARQSTQDMVRVLRFAHQEAIFKRKVRTVGIDFETNSYYIKADPIPLPGMGGDSVAYRVGSILFSGTALTAGETGSVLTPYAKELLLSDIREKVLSLPEETVILPFYGPPSTIGVERVTLPTDPPTELEASNGNVPGVAP